MIRPGWLTGVRDGATFALGLVIILKQAGILFPPPEGGPSIELLIIGALCSNVPGILQVVAWRSGMASSGSSPGPQPPDSSAPSSSLAGGGDR